MNLFLKKFYLFIFSEKNKKNYINMISNLVEVNGLVGGDTSIYILIFFKQTVLINVKIG